MEDARREALLESERQFQYYVPLAQAPAHAKRDLALLVRAGNPESIRIPLARSLQAVRADLPFVSVRTLEDVVAPELRPWRLGASVFGIFGALALLVAAVGMYSVMQCSVSQRTHEMGVRIALGARRGQIIRLVTAQALALAVLAAAAGVALVLVLGPFVRGLLFETSPGIPPCSRPWPRRSSSRACSLPCSRRGAPPAPIRFGLSRRIESGMGEGGRQMPKGFGLPRRRRGSLA